MRIVLGVAMTAAIALVVTAGAQAQSPCSSSENPYMPDSPNYVCTVSGDAAGQPLLLDCRRRMYLSDTGLAAERGCTIGAGPVGADVQRCTSEFAGYGGSSEVCHTNAFWQGYTCTRSGQSSGDGQHYTFVTQTRCDAHVGVRGQRVDSTCDEYLAGGASGYHEFRDGCTTTVTTLLARVQCTHDPVVPLDYFMVDVSRLLGLQPPSDDETATPACRRV